MTQPNQPVPTDSLPLRYSLPLTKLSLAVQKKKVLDITTGDGGNSSTRVKDETSAVLTTSIIADTRYTFKLTLDTKVLEKKEVAIELDENRVITGLNTSLSRDLTPILDAAAKILPIVTAALPFRGVGPEPSLEQQWAILHEEQAKALTGLLARFDSLIRHLAKEADPSAIADIGQAIEIVRREIVALDSIRRDWIADRVKVEEKDAFDLTILDTVELAKDEMKGVPPGGMPQSLPAGTALPGQQSAIAEKYDIMLAVYDPETEELRSQIPKDSQLNVHSGLAGSSHNQLHIRLPRIATFAIYHRPLNTEGVIDKTQPWVLKSESVQRVTLVDQLSAFRALNLDASWFKERKLDLSMHADQSISKYGSTQASTIGGIITSSAGLLDANKDLFKKDKPTPPAQEALDRAKAKIELLKASSELTRLANRYSLPDEIELANRLIRLADE